MPNPFEQMSAREPEHVEKNKKTEQPEKQTRARIGAPESFQIPPEVKEFLETERRKKEAIGYRPFDAALELLEFRKKRRKMDKKEQARGMFEIREQLTYQERGIADIISELRKMINRVANVSAEKLYNYVKRKAKLYRLTEEQLLSFDLSIQNYARVHAAVEKYRKQYPDNADLFEQCFGRKPHGKIEIEKGPFYLFFRCFDKKDYSLVANFDKTEGGDESKLTQKDLEWAEKTGGVALDKVKAEALNSVVIAERAQSAITYFVEKPNIPHFRTIATGEILSFQFNGVDGKNIVAVWSDGNETFTFNIEIYQRDGAGLPARIRLREAGESVIGSAGKPEGFIFDLIRVAPQTPFTDGTLQDAANPAEAPKTERRVYLTSGKKMFGEIVLSYDSLEIYSRHREDGKIVWSQTDVVEVPSEQRSDEIKTHEEQHQFNAFWEPVEFNMNVEKILRNVAMRAESPEKAKQDFLRLILKRERARMGVDTRGRDELLAYYQEGRILDEVYDILTAPVAEGGIYDPFDIYKKKIEGLPIALLQEFSEKNYAIYFRQFADMISKTAEVALEKAEEAALIGPIDIRTQIDEVFGKDYKRDLRLWVDSIKLLEQKGYDRDQVISLLYVEPVSEWPAFVRRIPNAHVH